MGSHHFFANYFDHAASSPVLPEVLEAMLPWIGEACGNEHSAHAWGRAARAACEEARVEVARLIGAEDPTQIVFTSGATEANNAVVAQFDRVVYSPFEHSSVVKAAEARPWSERRNLTLDPISRAEGEEKTLFCQMAVSNETGEVFGLPPTRAKTLVDATAAVGKVPYSVGAADFVSLSGHKFGAPKGIGDRKSVV